jgi:hypothetical protein
MRNPASTQGRSALLRAIASVLGEILFYNAEIQLCAQE